jgi:Protein of unknown function (DUF4231)
MALVQRCNQLDLPFGISFLHQSADAARSIRRPTAAVGTYQWEEVHNYGARWAKFRLVAERLKNHKELFLQRASVYDGLTDDQARKRFVEYCEGLLEGTDVNYFVLMIDPLRRNQT